MRFKNFFYLPLFFISYTYLLDSSAEQKKQAEAPTTGFSLSELMPAAPTRSLLIFIDDSEKELAAISVDLVSALRQKAGPILVSRHLLTNLHALYTIFGLTPDMPRTLAMQKDQKVKGVIQNINKILADRIPSKSLTKQEQKKLIDELDEEIPSSDINYSDPELVIEYTDFNPAEWIIKKVGSQEALVLLIPISYIKSITENQPSSATAALPIEFVLGLRIDALPTIESKDFWQFLSKPFIQKTSDYFMEAIWDPKKNSSPLFLTRTDFRKSGKISVQWAIFITGHGMPDEAIAALTIDQFKNLLIFLDSQIFTKLFVYSTCYAAGVNLQKVYTAAENSSYYKTHSFAIAFQGITELPTPSAFLRMSTYRLEEEDIDFEHKSLRLKGIEEEPLFDQFVKFAVENPIDYRKVITSIFRRENVTLQPQIKLPGMPFFNIIEVNKNLARIGTILAFSRDPKSPLSIKKFFNIDSPYIGLQVHEVPFEIIADSDWFNIISMLPGDAMHIVQKITAPKLEFSDLINLLLSTEYSVRKTFWIKQIDSKAIILKAQFLGESILTRISDKKPTITDLLIDMNDYNYVLYFTYNKKIFRSHGKTGGFVSFSNTTPKEITPDQYKEYEALLKEIRNDPALLAEQAKRKEFEEKNANVRLRNEEVVS